MIDRKLIIDLQQKQFFKFTTCLMIVRGGGVMYANRPKILNLKRNKLNWQGRQ